MKDYELNRQLINYLGLSLENFFNDVTGNQAKEFDLGNYYGKYKIDSAGLYIGLYSKKTGMTLQGIGVVSRGQAWVLYSSPYYKGNLRADDRYTATFYLEDVSDSTEWLVLGVIKTIQSVAQKEALVRLLKNVTFGNTGFIDLDKHFLDLMASKIRQLIKGAQGITCYYDLDNSNYDGKFWMDENGLYLGIWSKRDGMRAHELKIQGYGNWYLESQSYKHGEVYGDFFRVKLEYGDFDVQYNTAVLEGVLNSIRLVSHKVAMVEMLEGAS